MYKVGYYQFNPEYLNIDANLTNIEKDLHNIEADLLVLPELCVSGYDFQTESEVNSIAEDPCTGKSVVFFKKLAEKINCSIVYGFAEKSDSNIFNSAMLVNPDSTTHIYRKTHLFLNEKKWFTPGDTGFNIFKAKNGVHVGMMICFDWMFPEAMRTLALKGAQIICHPANLVLPWCQQAMFARSLENRVFSITCNRYGTESQSGKDLTFTGASQVLDCLGATLISAETDKKAIHFTEIEPEIAGNKNITSLNNIFEDRRIDFYGFNI